jgi:hypothetical protein
MAGLGLIHYNPGLPHQCDHAGAFQAAGFDITTDPREEHPGIHVVSGPHYAFKHWVGEPNVLMIDRAWWGDPDFVSLGWLQSDGSRTFAEPAAKQPSRSYPEPQLWKTREQSALVLADFGQDVCDIVSKAKSRFHYVRVRYHPADPRGRNQTSLESALAVSDVAIGSASSALVEAVLQGVPVICLDPDNVVAPVAGSSLDGKLYRGPVSQWLREMAFKQFSLEEIASGVAGEALWDDI